MEGARHLEVDKSVALAIIIVPRHCVLVTKAERGAASPGKSQGDNQGRKTN